MRWGLMLLLLVLCSSGVRAEESIEMKEPSNVRYKLPEVKTNADGQKCLGFEEWQKVVIIASEYKKNFDWRLSVQHVLLEYAALDGVYTLQSEDKERVIARLTDDRDRLELRLDLKEDERLKQLKGFRIERGLMWGVIIIETAVVGLLGIHAAVSP